MSVEGVDAMELERRFALLRSVGVECIQDDELRQMLAKKPTIRCYDGFEPSGRMHIAQGVFKAVNVNKCTDSGCEFVFWVADWFALMNDKVGGELRRIRIVGEYLTEVWKAANMNMDKVRFLWSSDEITSNASVYWKIVLDIARRNTIARIKKCCTIMGKQEGTLTAAQVLYPLMQCADIFFLKADICQLGLDQRKVNMLAREYCDLIGRKNKPVILSHRMLAGLKQGHAKMSKSDPESAVFMEDSEEDVARKIRAAYCPRVTQKSTSVSDDGAPMADDDKNPVLDYYECLIFSNPASTAVVDGVEYKSYAQLEKAFVDRVLSEEALKEGLIVLLNKLLQPVRKHFAEDPRAVKLLEQVVSFRTAGTTPAAPAVEPELGATPLAVAWLPAYIKFPLDLAIALSEAVKRFLTDNAQGEVVLVLPEWAAMTCNSLGGEEKYISAALELNAALLKAHWLPEERVRIMRQSEIILSHPNDYWLTAINVGRRNTLQHVEEVCKNLRNAGSIIAALMHAADTVTLKATHIIHTPHGNGYHKIVADFYKGRLNTISAPCGIIPVLSQSVPNASEHPTETSGSRDDVLFIDDTDMDIRRKIKKAYCAPNEDANPVLSIAAWLISRHGALLVERAEANGGDITYTEEAQIRAAALSGSLHPGDLKQAVSKELLGWCAATKGVLASPDGKKYAQTLKNAEKHLSKGK